MSIILLFLVKLKLVISLKKNNLIITILFILGGIALGFFYFFYTQNSGNYTENSNNYEATRTASKDNNTENNSNENTNNDSNEDNKKSENENIPAETPAPPTETNIATFSTKIYTKDSARQNNINITCSSLNDTIVKKGETFSFCGTVGQATTAKGYQKADIFDKNGNKKKGLRWW